MTSKVCPSCHRARALVLFRGEVCEACRSEPVVSKAKIVKRNKHAARSRRIYVKQRQATTQ